MYDISHRIKCAFAFINKSENVEFSVVFNIIHISVSGKGLCNLGNNYSLSNLFIKWKVISIWIWLHRKCQVSGQLSVLILVVLSAAFGTADHSLLDTLCFFVCFLGWCTPLICFITHWPLCFWFFHSFFFPWPLNVGVPQVSVLEFFFFFVFCSYLSLGDLIQSHGSEYTVYVYNFRISVSSSHLSPEL